MEGVLLVGLDDRSSKVIASQDSAKDIDEDGFDLWVIVEEFEGLHKLFSFGTAADVEEVSGLSTVLLDDVHSRHGKASTVDEAADISTDVNVVQVEFFGVLLASVFLRLVLLCDEVFLAESRVRVNNNLAIGGEHLVVLGQDKRVDLDHVAVACHEALVDLREHVGDLVSLVWGSEVIGGFVERCLIEAVDGVHGQFENLFWRLLSNLLDGHSTGRAVDEGWAASLAVEGEGEVPLLGDVNLLDQVDALDTESFRATLVGNKALADHLAGNLLGLIRVIDEVDTALEPSFFEVAKSATTAMDLRLDDTAAVDAASNLLGLLRAKGNIADRDGNLV